MHLALAGGERTLRNILKFADSHVQDVPGALPSRQQRVHAHNQYAGNRGNLKAQGQQWCGKAVCTYLQASPGRSAEQ
jgi:hypothetical protein